MKTLFVSLYNQEAYGLRAIHAHVAPHHEAALCFIKGLDSTERVTGEEMKLLAGLIAREGFGVVAVSLVSQQYRLFRELAPIVRSTGAILVVGGWHASLDPASLMGVADHVVVGEEERAMLRLLDQLQVGVKHPRVAGVYPEPVAPLAEPAREIPIFRGRSWVIDGTIEEREPYESNERYGTFLGRGCPFSCSYCSNSRMSAVYADWRKTRMRRKEDIKAELLRVRAELPNVKRVNFYDEIMREMPGEFWTWYAKQARLPFYCMFYPGTASRASVEQLKKAGLAGVWLGVQAGSERVRREIFGRSVSDEVIFQQAEIFADLGVSIRYDFILDNPFESWAETWKTLDMMWELPPGSFNLFSLKFFPHTDITDRAIAAGLPVTQDHEREGHYDGYLISPDSELNREALEIARQKQT